MSGDFATTDDGEREPAVEPGAPTLVLLYNGTSAVLPPTFTPLSPGLTVLGRAAEHPKGIVVDDKRVSRVHAVVQCEGRGKSLQVTDSGSRNGTAVNGSRIGQSALRDGDVLRIGDSLFLVRFQPAPPCEAPIGGLIGVSLAMARVRATLARVAGSLASVLLLGETGTGKEVAARYLHEQSGRPEPFLAVNCSALPESLAESQLFGHTKGAFTGAAAHPGFFRAAHRGTLFLDEVGELSESVQPKLLRVLEDRKIFPVGSVTGQPIDVRLLFATNRNILTAISSGRFRADLYARMAEVVVNLPPLRMRREDTFLLLHHALGLPGVLTLPPTLAEAMLLYDWPFNVREIVKLATEILATGDLSAIEARLRKAPVGVSEEPSSEVDPNAPQRDQLVELLRMHSGNVAAVARILKCPRKYIYRWAEQYTLDLNEYRP